MSSKELALFGRDLFGDVVKPKASGPVAERFLFPPFSVLSARDGDWQDRKRAWLRVGIESEVGRDAKAYHAHEWCEKVNDAPPAAGGGTSIFDPVLCECIYRWFCADEGQVVDPFAGGSVRGIVAGMLGRRYWGCDLRAEQIAANETQADTIEPAVRPVWVCGDSLETLETAPRADLIFSCPPYGDLEQYCDDPRDLSNMDWHTFCATYKRIILRACARLKANRFACFVVGNFRDPAGFFRDLLSETVHGFSNSGVYLYNEAILVTAVGSAAIRVTKQFECSRKFVKTHQNVLVFCKGDPKEAARVCQDTTTEQGGA